MAEAGANVIVWYTSKSIDDRIAELTTKYGIKARAYKCDIQDQESVFKTVDEVVKDFGKIDVFIANAGVHKLKSVLESTLEEWKQIVDVNYNGSFYCAKAVGAVFKKQGYGNLIFTASISAHVVNLEHGPYAASKAGIVHLAKSLAIEWREFARVNVVSPGYVLTDMLTAVSVQQQAGLSALTPIKRLAQPKEMKGVFLFLASDASSYATGTEIIIDGGYVCV